MQSPQPPPPQPQLPPTPLLGNGEQKPGELQLVRLTEEERWNVMNVVQQYLRDHPTALEGSEPFHAISVWYADVANSVLKAETPPGDLCVIVRTFFDSPHLMARAKAIWDSGLLPVEVVRMIGGSFYSLPRDIVVRNAWELDLESAECEDS